MAHMLPSVDFMALNFGFYRFGIGRINKNERTVLVSYVH